MDKRVTKPIKPSRLPRYRCKRCSVTIRGGDKIICDDGPCPMEVVPKDPSFPTEILILIGIAVMFLTFLVVLHFLE